jgi:hypothetical protein
MAKALVVPVERAAFCARGRDRQTQTSNRIRGGGRQQCCFRFSRDKPNLVDASSTTRSHMNKLRHALVVAVFAAVAVASVSVPAFAASSIKVHNKSKWEIHHMYLSPTSEKDEWGPDQLGDQVIKANGGVFTLTDIECNKYDIKIVDEDGDECIVSAVALCDDSATWNITDERLLKCEKKSE